MILRRSQRELIENVEESKERLIADIEKTDEMQLKLEELRYEKHCILHEISRIKKLDTQELECLGIPVDGEKVEILKRFENEFQARQDLKNQLTSKEKMLETEKANLYQLETMLKAYSEIMNNMLKAGDSLNSLLIAQEST